MGADNKPYAEAKLLLAGAILLPIELILLNIEVQVLQITSAIRDFTGISKKLNTPFCLCKLGIYYTFVLRKTDLFSLSVL